MTDLTLRYAHPSFHAAAAVVRDRRPEAQREPKAQVFAVSRSGPCRIPMVTA